jgi:subtilisin family serine protease
MAAPHVSGAAALILAGQPALTTAGVRSAILEAVAAATARSRELGS